MTAAPARWHTAAAIGRRAGQRLSLRASRAVPAAAGSRLGTNLGDSVEFVDHRPYEAGDDLRRIDWSVFGRTDELMVRRYRAETTPRVEIMLDPSRSMDRPSVKGDCALAIAAAIGEAATRDGLRPVLFAASDRLTPVPEPGTADAWRGYDGNAARVPSVASPIAGRPSARLLITDLMFTASPRALLPKLAGVGGSVAIVCVLARAERDPRQLIGHRLRDAETGGISAAEIDDRAAAEYQERLERHLAAWADAARGLGVAFADVIAEDALADEAFDPRHLLRAGVLAVRP